MCFGQMRQNPSFSTMNTVFAKKATVFKEKLSNPLYNLVVDL